MAEQNDETKSTPNVESAGSRITKLRNREIAELCSRCGLLDANPEHPAKVCIYCVLELNRRIAPQKNEIGEEKPGIGDS